MVLCDGEIVDNQALNRPVGLFEVGRFNEALAGNAAEFLPELFFYHGKVYKDGAHLPRILEEEYAPRMRALIPAERQELDHWAAETRKFGLCPVTRRIALRSRAAYVPSGKPVPPDSDIFISFASEDAALARQVYDHLAGKKGMRVFFSEETLDDPDFSRAIDKALERARILVAVGTKLDHLDKGWVQYEWRSFHNDIRSNRKPNGRLLPLIQGIDPHYLPRPLQQWHATPFTPSTSEESFKRLIEMMA